MGFLNGATEDRVEFPVVASARGRLTVDLPERGIVMHPKARVFILEDRTAVLVTPGDAPGTVAREVFAVDTSMWVPHAKRLTASFVGGGGIDLDGSGCGCGMGAVGNAGPSDGGYRLTPVRAPEWHTSG